MAQQADLSVHISSFFISIEAIFLLILVTKHFQIKTGDDDERYDEDAYDELQGSIVAGVAVNSPNNRATTNATDNDHCLK